MATCIHLWGFLILLTQFPGVLCEQYNIAGMAAAVVAAFILLVIVIILIVVSFIWTQWYPRWQRLRGRVKVPRQKWKWFSSNKEISREYILAKDFNYHSESRHSRSITTPQSTIVRANASQRPDTWIQEENSDFFNRAGEDQSKTMNFSDEHKDEPIIIAEVLPEGTVDTRDVVEVEPQEQKEMTDADYQYTHVIRVSEEQPIGSGLSASRRPGVATMTFADEEIEITNPQINEPMVVLY